MLGVFYDDQYFATGWNALRIFGYENWEKHIIEVKLDIDPVLSNKT